MNRTYSPAQSIERFAQVSAVLDYGLAARPVVLCAAGLGEETWDSVERHWIEKLGANDGADLAQRFGATYAASVQSLFRAPAERTGGEISAPSSDASETLRDMPLELEDIALDPTLELPPFWSGGGPPPLVEPSAEPEPASAPATRRSRATFLPPPPHELADDGDPADRTQVLPLAQLIGVSVLHRYDPWTGKPLPVPVWIDEVVSPKP